jgi:hypothetical protein
MPAVVAASRIDKIFPCGYCHLADGNGRPENAKIAGLHNPCSPSLQN